MKITKLSYLKVILVVSCLIMIMSFFMSWATIIVAHVSAYDLAMGAFSGGSPNIVQRFMFILLVMPIIVLIQVIFEYFIGLCYWYVHLINGLIILFSAIYYSTVSTADIGFIMTIIGAIILCLVSIGLKYVTKQRDEESQKDVTS
jgi:hypothetical protein